MAWPTRPEPPVTRMVELVIVGLYVVVVGVVFWRNGIMRRAGAGRMWRGIEKSCLRLS